MPITPSYSSLQIIGLPNVIKFIDTSSGSDVSVVGRRIYLTDYKNSPVVPDGTNTSYIEWDINDSEILVDVLQKDMALITRVSWVDVNGDEVVGKSNGLQGFSQFNESFYFSLTQAQAMQNAPPPMIMQDSVFYNNKMILRVLLDSAIQAIVEGGDITTAQSQYDQATYMVSNQSKYF